MGVAFLTFVEDDAQELAEYLVTHSNHLNITEYSDLIGRYGLSDSSRRLQMDHRVTLALTNIHTPHSLLGQLGQGAAVLRTLIHISYSKRKSAAAENYRQDSDTEIISLELLKI
ncbi:hypothetical protein MHYP_G00241160 [Metynnis hypsauchen]